MSTYSDLQTKHFYGLLSGDHPDHVDVKTNSASGLTRIMGYKDADWNSTEPVDGAKALWTSDIFDKKLVKRAKITEVLPTYFRKWVINPMASVASDTTYSLYFYLENMNGFGIQDRWDLVSDYTTESGTSNTVNDVMTALKNDLNEKLNPVYADTPLKNDFKVTILDGTMSVKEAEKIFKTTDTPDSASWTDSDSESLTKGSGTVSGNKYTLVKHEGSYKKTYVYDNVAEDLAVNSIVVYENSESTTFEKLDELAYRMHDNPYVYDVTLSTYDNKKNAIWGDNAKRIMPTETNEVYVSAYSKLLAMELFFLRNRADLYDLTSDFKTSIMNKPRVNEADYAYVLDIDYAFSDTQGYTYHSDKQMAFGVTSSSHGTPSVLSGILSAINS